MSLFQYVWFPEEVVTQHFKECLVIATRLLDSSLSGVKEDDWSLLIHQLESSSLLTMN